MMQVKVMMGACALALGVFGAGASYAAYPEKPVTVVVGFAPGGTNDIVARLLSNELEKRLGQTFVVENKPGASSMISANYVKRATPDGYTLLVISSGGLTVNPAVYKPERVAYDPVADFTPVAQLATFPLVLVTGPKLKHIASISELIEHAKKANAPLTHGVATSAFQLAAEVFTEATGVTFTHVPYRGSGPVAADLMGGQTDVAFLDTAAVVPFIEGKRLQALGVTTSTRSGALPETPTIAEAGPAGFNIPIWTGLVAPAGTPEEVVNTLNGALKEAFEQPEIKERFRQLGMETGAADGAVLATAIKTDLARWTKVAKDAGIQIE